MLDPAGARPPIESTANPVRNPTVELPLAAEEVVRALDAVLVTHRHKDHLDDTAVRLIPRDVAVFCQPEDEDGAAGAGARRTRRRHVARLGRPRVHRVPARHGHGAVAEAARPGQRLRPRRPLSRRRHSLVRGGRGDDRALGPRVAVVNAAGASFLEGGLIVMGIDDVREVVARVPVVVAVHLEALNHCHLTRAELAAAVPGVVIPRDGETVEV